MEPEGEYSIKGGDKFSLKTAAENHAKRDTKETSNVTFKKTPEQIEEEEMAKAFEQIR